MFVGAGPRPARPDPDQEAVTIEKGKLGVIGGMGPQATIQFCQRIVDLTAARFDQEHLPLLVLNDTQMPDRTAALLSGDREPVEERLLADAGVLAQWGAAAIAITCNTAHAFLPAIKKRLPVPVVNMIDETAEAVKAMGCRRVGILGTDGTLHTGLYHAALEKRGIETLSPSPAAQEGIMSLIYDEIKGGLPGREEKFAPADQELREKGCERIILACTELSAYGVWHGLDGFYVDAMDVLARRCVEVCGYPLREYASRGGACS